MNMFSSLLSGNYVDLVKTYIDKVFVHEAKRYQCEKSDLSIIISSEPGGEMQVMTYQKSVNKVWRIIPDNELQNILMK